MTTLAARVPIANFQDILDAMAQNPELEEQMRRHLQDEDFRNLPAAVARLAAGLEELAGIARATAEREERRDADIAELKEEQARQGADIAELKEGQARHDADIAELKEGQARLEAGQARHDADIAELKEGQARLEAGQARHDADIAELKEGQARLEAGQARHDADIAELKEGQARLEAGQARHDADIAELKAGQDELKAGQARHDADIAELKEGQARLEAGQEELKDGLTRVQGGLNRLAGTDYERNIARRLRRNADRYFGIHRAELIHSVILPNNNALLDLLDGAFRRGLISREETDSTENVDMVIEGEDHAGAACYAVIEASVTVDRNDVDRALSRGRIIARSTAASVVPAVVGVNIPDQVRSYADGFQVAAVVISD